VLNLAVPGLPEGKREKIGTSAFKLLEGKKKKKGSASGPRYEAPPCQKKKKGKLQTMFRRSTSNAERKKKRGKKGAPS